MQILRTRLGASSLTTIAAAALLFASGCSTSDDGTADGGGNDSGITEDTGTINPGPDATMNQEPDSSTSNDAGQGTDAGKENDGSQASDTGTHPDASHPLDAGGRDTGAASDAGDAGADAADSSTSDDGAAGDDGGANDSGDAGDGSTLPALIGQWNFDEDAGASSADLSGNGHPAVLTGGASWGAGKEGNGLVLDGTSGYADIGMTLIDTTKSFSVMSWTELNVVNNWEIAVSEDDVNGSLFGLKLRGDGTNAYDFDVETSDVVSPGFAVAQSVTTAVASVWVHLAGVYDASGTGAVKVYVNGALEANTVVGQALVGATGHFLIGRGLYNDATGSFLNGTVDEVAVYGGALTDAQVAAIYAAQK